MATYKKENMKTRDDILQEIAELHDITAVFVVNDVAASELSKIQIRRMLCGRLYENDEFKTVVVKGYRYALDKNGNKIASFPRIHMIDLPERKDENNDFRTV